MPTPDNEHKHGEVTAYITDYACNPVRKFAIRGTLVKKDKRHLPVKWAIRYTTNETNELTEGSVVFPLSDRAVLVFRSDTNHLPGSEILHYNGLEELIPVSNYGGQRK